MLHVRNLAPGQTIQISPGKTAKITSIEWTKPIEFISLPNLKTARAIKLTLENGTHLILHPAQTAQLAP